MKNCPYCGAELTDDTAVCPLCSAELSAEIQAPSPPPVQPAATVAEPPVVPQPVPEQNKPASHKFPLAAIICLAAAIPVLLISSFAIRLFRDRKEPDIADDNLTAVQTVAVQTTVVLETETAAAITETATSAATAANTQLAETAPPVTEITDTEPPKPAENDDWRYAYRDHVRNCDSQVNPTFSLYDVTGDGIPELIVSEGMYTAAGTEIYTFEKGAVRRMQFDMQTAISDSFGANGMCAYNKDKKMLCVSNIHMGYTYTTYMQFNGTDFEFYVSMMRSSFDPEMGQPDEFYIDDNSVTKEEYEAEHSKYENDSLIALGTDHNIFDGQAIMEWHG